MINIMKEYKTLTTKSKIITLIKMYTSVILFLSIFIIPICVFMHFGLMENIFGIPIILGVVLIPVLFFSEQLHKYATFLDKIMNIKFLTSEFQCPEIMVKQM